MNRLIATPTHLGPDGPCWNETLTDGTQVLIRPLCKLDATAERVFIEGLSSKTKHNRFLGQIAHPADRLIQQLTDIDYDKDMALAAVDRSGRVERIVGVSRYAVQGDGGSCECAVVVADAWQNRGLGTALMRHLIEIASERGLRWMESTDLRDNLEMRDLARFLGFRARQDPEDAHMVVYSLQLGN